MDPQLNIAFWKALLAGILRNALAGLSSAAIAKGYVSDGQVSMLIVGAAGLLVSLGWNFLHKQKVRAVIAAALKAPAGAGYEDAKEWGDV